MRRNVLRFYGVFFFFVLALALMQFIVLNTSSSSFVSGFAVSDNKVAVVLVTFPLLALFLLGIFIVLLLMQPHAPLPRHHHIPLNLQKNKDFDRPAVFK